MYEILLDLRKVFDAMDRGRCLETLEDAGVGPYALRLIKSFWENEVLLMCRASFYYGGNHPDTQPKEQILGPSLVP